MTSNLYFAYSIKKGFEDPKLAPEPVLDARRKKTRACDACSIRKTKCDESRPCRHCVSNGLDCRDLRERKKSGPKTLRKKTIEHINALSKEPRSEPDDSSTTTPTPPALADLRLVVHALSSAPPHVFRACVPFTVPAMVHDGPVLIASLLETDAAALPYTSSKRYAVATLALVVLHMLKTVEDPVRIGSLSAILSPHVSSCGDACRQSHLVLPGPAGDFDTQYYLALAELHLFSYMMLSDSSSANKLVHLRTAITHYQILEFRYGKDNSSLLAELRRTLYLWERHAYLFDLDATVRGVGVLLPPVSHLVHDAPINFPVLDHYFLMLYALDDMLVFLEPMPEPFTWVCAPVATSIELNYSAIKAKLFDERVAGGSGLEASLVDLMGATVLLRVLLLYSKELERAAVAEELVSLVVRVNGILASAERGIKMYMESFAFAVQLLELLRATLHVIGDPEESQALNALLQLSSYISLYMSSHMEFLMKDAIISNWYSRLMQPPVETLMN